VRKEILNPDRFTINPHMHIFHLVKFHLFLFKTPQAPLPLNSVRTEMTLLNSLKGCVIALWLGDTKLRQLERNYYALGMFCLSILLAYGNDSYLWFDFLLISWFLITYVCVYGL